MFIHSLLVWRHLARYTRPRADADGFRRRSLLTRLSWGPGPSIRDKSYHLVPAGYWWLLQWSSKLPVSVRRHSIVFTSTVPTILYRFINEFNELITFALCIVGIGERLVWCLHNMLFFFCGGQDPNTLVKITALRQQRPFSSYTVTTTGPPPTYTCWYNRYFLASCLKISSPLILYCIVLFPNVTTHRINVIRRRCWR